MPLSQDEDCLLKIALKTRQVDKGYTFAMKNGLEPKICSQARVQYSVRSTFH